MENFNPQKGTAPIVLIVVLVATAIVFGGVYYFGKHQVKAVDWVNHPEMLDQNNSCGKAVFDQLNDIKNDTLANTETFAKYKTIDLFTEPFAPFDINSNPYAHVFRGSINDKLAETDVNFAGHYSIINVGMTGYGSNYYIIDRKTGKAYILPYQSTFVDFRKDSNLIVINPKQTILDTTKKEEEYGYQSYCSSIVPGMIHGLQSARSFYFLWQNNKFTLIGPKDRQLPMNIFFQDKEIWKEYFDSQN